MLKFKTFTYGPPKIQLASELGPSETSERQGHATKGQGHVSGGQGHANEGQGHSSESRSQVSEAKIPVFIINVDICSSWVFSISLIFFF